MTIKTGDTLPSIPLKRLGREGMESFDLAEHISGKKVIIFAVPGAFTPTCAQKHLPGYVAHADDIKSKGIDEIICVAVNDPFVMKHWGETANTEGRVTMIPDGNGDLTKALGLEMDGSGFGLGIRSKRYIMICNNGIVEDLQIEENPGEVELSGADICMTKL